MISTSLIKEVRSSYHNDPMIQTIIKDLQGSANSHPHYTWVHDHLNKKGKVVVGNNMALRSQIISLFHNLAVGGHSGMTVTSKTVTYSIGKDNKNTLDSMCVSVSCARETSMRIWQALAFYNPCLSLLYHSLISAWTSWKVYLNQRERMSSWS